MRRRLKNALSAFYLLSLTVFFGYIAYCALNPSTRVPANVGLAVPSAFDHSTLSVSVSEFQTSRPPSGRSYFDLVFSETVGNQQQYKVPFPFNKVIAKLEDYTGKKVNPRDASGPKVTIFPMGRSLQRNAAIHDSNQAFSFDPFFRYPRIVLGVDEEPTYENSLVLNLKNKIYIGFNERAEIIEAISYNDDEGRYEYQVIRDYAEGKKPQVVYANRSLCLSCHQNQTPIFSRGPWSESNANSQMADQLKQKLDAAFGAPACTDQQNQAYCYKANNEPYYFGAPVRIDLTTTSRLDASTDSANLMHAYQKMWKELCTSVECRSEILKAILLLRLNGQTGLVQTPSLVATLKNIETQWQQKFPGGLAIPSPNVPNRDPLKDFVNQAPTSSFSTVTAQNQNSVQDLLAGSKIPTEFEPLQPRAPIELWKDSAIDVANTNRLIRGLADEFTQSDMKMIDAWLKQSKTDKEVLTELTAGCQIDKDSSSLAVSCQSNGEESFTINAYLNVQDRTGQGDVSDFSIQSAKLNCDPQLAQTDANIFQGRSCPSMTNLTASYSKIDDNSATLFLRKKDGLSLRTLQGYYVAEVVLDLANQKAKIKVYDQSALVKTAFLEAGTMLLGMRSFSRFQIMKNLTTYARMKMIREQNMNMNGLGLNAEGDVSLDTLLANATGPSLLKNVCAQCHKNNETVPPNFMGEAGKDISNFDQCRRIEQCAPRMLYRMKMRNCDQSTNQKKKNPMPPESFLRNNKLATADWMKNHNPKVIQYLKTLIDVNALNKDLQTHGLPAAEAQKAANDILNADCPSSNSVIYDQLPKCEFNQLKPTTRCQ